MAIRVVIVDDHAIVRAGMRMLLESDPEIEIVGEGESGLDAIRLARECSPNVVVMDVTMPGMDGVEATRKIKTENPDLAVLAVTIHEGPDYFFRMLQAGSSGYVPKRAAPDDLVRAIHVVAEGNVFLEPGIARDLVNDYIERMQEGSEQQDSLDDLTEREREVVAHIADGATNREVAEVLGISVKTVGRHCENVMQKLNLHSRAELVKYAIRKNIISI